MAAAPEPLKRTGPHLCRFCSIPVRISREDQDFCSSRCRTKYERHQRGTHQGRKEEWLNLPKRHCDNCGKLYKPSRPDSRYCSSKCRFDFHNHGGSFAALKKLIEPAVRKYCRLEDECPKCAGTGQINKGARVGVVVCETCINGRVLTPFGRNVLALVSSGHVKVGYGNEGERLVESR
jgi:predicted nucleic acid-binding Zn ribbon protein